MRSTVDPLSALLHMHFAVENSLPTGRSFLETSTCRRVSLAPLHWLPFALRISFPVGVLYWQLYIGYHLLSVALFPLKAASVATSAQNARHIAEARAFEAAAVR